MKPKAVTSETSFKNFGQPAAAKSPWTPSPQTSSLPTYGKGISPTEPSTRPIHPGGVGPISGRSNIAIVLHYQDKEDVIPFVKNADNLEYEISSRLRVMSQTRRRRCSSFFNHNEVSPNALKQGPAGRLFEEFRVESLQLSKVHSGVIDAVFSWAPNPR